MKLLLAKASSKSMFFKRINWFIPTWESKQLFSFDSYPGFNKNKKQNKKPHPLAAKCWKNRERKGE